MEKEIIIFLKHAAGCNHYVKKMNTCSAWAEDEFLILSETDSADALRQRLEQTPSGISERNGRKG